MDVLPIDLTAIIAVIMGMLVVLIPVAGLTARFALKPVVEAIAHMRSHQGERQELAILERRMALMEQQLQLVEGSVERLGEERDFQRQLEHPRT